MHLDKKNLLKILLIILFAGVVLACALNPSLLLSGSNQLMAILSPFLIGACLAFVINVPMRFLETRIFAPANRKGGRVWLALRRPVCLVISILIILGLLTVVGFLIVPEIQHTLENIAETLPARAAEILASFKDWLTGLHISTEFLEDFSVDWQKISAWLMSFVSESGSSLLGSTIGFTSELFTGIFNAVLGFAFSIYILASKEKLCLQGRKILFALLRKDRAEETLRVLAISNNTFSGFVAGQLTEAVILGILCYIGMLIFQMPYAVMISSLIMVTALIPIFGAFFGTTVGALMILLVNPLQAVWFVLFIIVLQQLEGNIIYPKVVGTSVGLPGIWVLMCVTLGGSFFGAFGMLVSVPTCAVLYTLFRQYVYHRLRTKGMEPFPAPAASLKAVSKGAAEEATPDVVTGKDR